MTTISLPRPIRYAAQDDDEFVRFDDVPVFAEHKADDGFYYGRRELQWICDNMNRRIDDTGDYCPIVVQHTADSRETPKDPPVIGFGGPFQIGRIGNTKPRWAILGVCRVFKGDEETFRRHPRRSVELWVEDDPRDRFFDPICVLGAETPRLDLGMVYSRKHPDRRIVRYQAAPVAAFPSGTNTFVPSFGSKKKKHDKESSPVALSPDDISQIVDALRATAEFQFVREWMKQSGGAEGDDDADGAGGQDGGEPSDELPQDGMPRDGMPSADASDSSAPGSEAGSPDVPDLHGEPERQAVELMKKCVADGDMDGWNRAYDSLDDDTRRKAMRYALEGSPDDGSADGRDGAGRDGDGGYEGPDEYDSGYASDVPMVAARGVDGKRFEPGATAARGGGLTKKYARLRRDHDDLRGRHAVLLKRAERAERDSLREQRRSERYARLRDLEAEGYNLDAVEEIEGLVDATDEQFERHVARIHRNYQRIASDGLNRATRMSSPERLDRYARLQGEREEQSNRIRDYALRHKVTYAKAREVIEGEAVEGNKS